MIHKFKNPITSSNVYNEAVILHPKAGDELSVTEAELEIIKKAPQFMPGAHSTIGSFAKMKVIECQK